MRKLLPLSLLLLWALSANAAPLIRVVAMVNNDAVTSYQLEKKLSTAQAATTKESPLSNDEQQLLRLKILNDMIEDLLVEQRILNLGLSVSAQELTSAIEDIQKQNNLSREQLENALQAQGMSFSEYQQSLRREILRYKLISREVRSKVEVTSLQVRNYFKEHEDEYRSKPTLRLGRISYPVAENLNEKAKEQLMQLAQIARQQLLAGKPFAEVLKLQGTDAEGGDMGVMAADEMNPQLQQGIEGLEPRQVSEPLEVLGSIHLFQVIERTPAKSELNPEIRLLIEKVLADQNSEKRFAEWKKELRKDAAIDIRI